jgi:hypothetical protein
MRISVRVGALEFYTNTTALNQILLLAEDLHGKTETSHKPKQSTKPDTDDTRCCLRCWRFRGLCTISVLFLVFRWTRDNLLQSTTPHHPLIGHWVDTARRKAILGDIPPGYECDSVWWPGLPELLRLVLYVGVVGSMKPFNRSGIPKSVRLVVF